MHSNMYVISIMMFIHLACFQHNTMLWLFNLQLVINPLLYISSLQYVSKVKQELSDIV